MISNERVIIMANKTVLTNTELELALKLAGLALRDGEFYDEMVRKLGVSDATMKDLQEKLLGSCTTNIVRFEDVKDIAEQALVLADALSGDNTATGNALRKRLAKIDG